VNVERWERIQRLVAEALDEPAASRPAFVAAACAGDTALREEVLSLLGAPAVEHLPEEWLGSVGAPVPAVFAAGERVADRYVIEQMIGRGGMSEVYQAHDETLSIPVALKVLMRAGDSGARLERLKLESLLARAVWHPHVCRVYELGHHGPGDAPVWFLTMELLRGMTLEERLERDGPLPRERVLRLAAQMGSGLGAAHRAGVVHRDFKPGNVMLVGTGDEEQAVVTDFGTARAMPRGGRPDLPEGPDSIYGTPAYMAPEQVRGDAAGPAADVYALGVVLYEMVTGVRPFDGGSAMDVARRRLEADPPSPRLRAPDLDDRWEATILRCLERDPRHRFARVEHVAEALAGRLPHRRTGTVPREDRTLPAERDPFVGREGDIEALAHVLSGGARLVTLAGAGGMGKTRLAVHYARRALRDWPGGVWFCDLTEAQDMNGIAAAVGGPLGVRLERDPVAQLGHAIASRGPCVLILDNFEHLVDRAEATVGRWMRQAPEARWLVTSRARLNVEGEVLQPLEPLPADAGVELFVLRARGLHPGFTPAAEDRDTLRDIVRLVDGMPLAIELAAARIRVMGITDILGRMRTRLRLLAGGRDARHETLAGAIDGSWELLKPWERAAWAQCAVFEGGFTLDAAMAVLELGAWPGAPPVVDVLQALVDTSMLRTWTPEAPPDAPAPEPRFGMFVSLQAYAREKGEEAHAEPGPAMAAWHGTLERHGRWCARLGTDEAIEGLYAHGGVSRRRALVWERENLLAACRHAISRGDAVTAVATYRAAWEVLDLFGPFDTGIELGLAVLRCPSRAAERAHALLALSRAERRAGRAADAWTHAQEAMATFRRLGDRGNTSATQALLAILLNEQGRYAEGRLNGEAALTLARESGHRRAEAQAHNALGIALSTQGLLPETQAHFEAALAIHRDLGDRGSEGMLLNNLGLLSYERGLREESRACYEEALAIHRETGDRRSEGVVLTGIANWCGDEGRPDEERMHLEAALAIHREIGARAREAIVLGNLAALISEPERKEESRALYDTALTAARETGNRPLEASLLGHLGEQLLAWGDLGEARAALARAEALAREMGDPVETAKVLCHRAHLELRQGDPAGARATMHEAEALAADAAVGGESPLGAALARLRDTLAAIGPSPETSP